MESFSIISVIGLLTPIIYQLGLTLGIGSSTFALTFYLQFLQDGEMHPIERRVLHTVFFFLRLGMALIIASLILFYALESTRGISLLTNPGFVTQSIIMAVIVVNAVLMTYRIMPMWLGPVLAGGSWYALFFLRVLPFENPNTPYLLFLYGAFVAVFFVAFTLIRKYYWRSATLTISTEHK